MLKIIVKELNNGWMAKATLSGRGISDGCKEWETGRTREEALNKLNTKLKKEQSILDAAQYRISACSKLCGLV